jgi:hypothetical protein
MQGRIVAEPPGQALGSDDGPAPVLATGGRMPQMRLSCAISSVTGVAKRSRAPASMACRASRRSRPGLSIAATGRSARAGNLTETAYRMG